MKKLISMCLAVIIILSNLVVTVSATTVRNVDGIRTDSANWLNDIESHKQNENSSNSELCYDEIVDDVYMAVGDHTISEGEPNDFYSQATRIYNDYTVSGNLTSSDLIDSFKFTVTEKSEVMIVVVAKYSSFMMGIWDSSDEIVAASGKGSYTSGGKYGFNIVKTLNPGAYYLNILDADALYNVYTFYITIEPLSVSCTHNTTSSTVVEPTCTAQGYTSYTCTKCKYQWKDNYTSATGHSWGGWVIGKEASCTELGEEYRTCTSCGTFEYRDIFSKSHTEVQDMAVEATCGEPGKTAGSHCVVCDTVIKKQEVIPATGNHTYSSNSDTTCNVCGYVRQFSNVKSVPMYRMYDPNSSEHFYTGSIEERGGLVAVGWNYEGVGFNFPVAGDPVHRLYEPKTGEHLYTMSEEEKAALLSSGWTYEGVAFNSAGKDEVPQYRLHNPNETRGAYHFTGSTEERDHLISIGWEYQGIGWYSCLK